MKFSDLGLSAPVVHALEVAGFLEPTPIQAAAIPVALGGADVFGRSVTGSGKTLAFGLPAIEKIDPEDRRVQALIVAPTRELAEQITEQLRRITNSLDRVKATLIAGGMDITRQIKAIKSGARIVVGTPGRLCDHLRRATLKTDGIRYVVLDEADEMLKMGFRAELDTVMAALPAARQTLLFSATLPPEVENLAACYTKEPKRIEGDARVTVDTVTQGYLFCKSADKTAVLAAALKAVDTDRCIVFCNTRAAVDALSRVLTEAGIAVEPLHGLMKQADRRRALAAVRANGGVLVATDVAARGLDIDGIGYVFHFDVPHERDFYIHRIGRTARAGKSGVAVALCATRAQQEKLAAFVAETGSELVPMAIADGKLIRTEPVPDRIERELLRARAEGDVGRTRELAEGRAEKERTELARDDAIERMLGALRKKASHGALIEDLRAFGYSDEQLLDAALTLWEASEASRERSHRDRGAARKGPARPPAPHGKPFPRRGGKKRPRR